MLSCKVSSYRFFNFDYKETTIIVSNIMHNGYIIKDTLLQNGAIFKMSNISVDILLLVITLEDNARLRSKLARKALPKKEYIEIEMDDGKCKYENAVCFLTYTLYCMCNVHLCSTGIIYVHRCSILYVNNSCY